MDILIRIGLGFLGILFYALLTAKDKNDTQTLSVWGYFKGNYSKWLISLLIVSVLSIYLQIVPQGGVSIKAMTGLAVTTELSSFMTLGYILVSTGRKIGKKLT